MDVSSIASVLNVDEDTARFLVGIMLTFPLGYWMSLMPYGLSKHVFASIAGLYLLRFTLGDQWIHVPIATVVSYAMLWKLPRDLGRYAVPTYAMAYCSYVHILRQFYGTFDFSCPQMMLTIKLYSIAWNLYDGHCIHQNRQLSRASQNCKSAALIHLPPFLEFSGYCLNFSTVLVGPAYEFVLYKNVCDGVYKKPLTSRWRPVLVPLLTAAFFAAYHGLLVGKYNVLSNPDLSIIGYIIAFSVFKAKLYFIWKYVESANNIWFAGFNMDVSSNVDIWDIETAPNLSTFTKRWNKKTAEWLNRYVYQRHDGNAIVVYIIAAVWHGFYPGYYLAYGSAVLWTACERLGRQRLSPRFKHSIVYRIAKIASIHVIGAYLHVVFVLRDLDSGLCAWQSQYFAGHLAMIGFYVCVYYCCREVGK